MMRTRFGASRVLSTVAIAAAPPLLVLVAMVLPVAAKDSHAPPGARDRWLPCEQWVMFHWLPFDDRRLYAMTGIGREEFRRFIRDDDRHTLGRLIRRHGKDPDEIVSRLMSRWRGKVGEARLAELTRRAGELMTQGHLAQHVFFHYYHHPAIALNAKWIFNVRSADYHRARLHQDIHQHRQGQFPSGNRSLKGSRLKQACTYMAGSSHPAGEHDDAG